MLIRTPKPAFYSFQRKCRRAGNSLLRGAIVPVLDSPCDSFHSCGTIRAATMQRQELDRARGQGALISPENSQGFNPYPAPPLSLSSQQYERSTNSFNYQPFTTKLLYKSLQLINKYIFRSRLKTRIWFL